MDSLTPYLFVSTAATSVNHRERFSPEEADKWHSVKTKSCNVMLFPIPVDTGRRITLCVGFGPKRQSVSMSPSSQSIRCGQLCLVLLMEGPECVFTPTGARPALAERWVVVGVHPSPAAGSGRPLPLFDRLSLHGGGGRRPSLAARSPRRRPALWRRNWQL